MKPPVFDYYEADDVGAAIGLLNEHGDEAKVLAGGQSLVPMMSLRLAYPSALIDVNGCTELDYVDARDNELAIGALTRHATLERSDTVARLCPLLRKAMRWVAHGAIRNRGTLGGSLAHADPAAELAAVAAALDATVVARSVSGTREIPIGEFFVMPLVSALNDGELLTEVRLAAQPSGSGSAVVEIARRHGDFAVAGVAATVTLRDGRLGDVRLVAFAAGPRPLRLTEAEELLTGSEPSDHALADAGRLAAGAVSPNDDVHASAEYRRRVVAVLVERALREAIEEARANPMEV